MKYSSIKYNNKKYKTIILSKNLLLFRVFNSDTNNTDFLGIKTEDTKYVLPFDYNVFFYTLPYVADTNFYLNKTPRNVFIYKLNYKIELLVIEHENNPLINTNINIIELPVDICSNINHYNDKIQGRQYDLCMKREFIEKYPKISGLYYVSTNDSGRYYSNINRFDQIIKEQPFLTKNNLIDIPHISLYPLRNRKCIDIINTSDSNNKIISKKGYIYELVKWFPHRQYKADKFLGYLNNIKNKYKESSDGVGYFII